jgi:hypothetical protein
LKLKKINEIRVVKIIQLLLYFLFIVLLARNNNYLSLIPLIIGFVLELLVPREYGWGLIKNKKNVFISSEKNWLEPLITFLFLIFFIIVTYIYLT